MKRTSEVIRLGNIYYDDCGGNYAGNVYERGGCCPAILTMSGGNRQPMIVDRICVRQIGRRNPDNPSDRSRGAYVEQMYEPADNPHVCNTITSVQKDNMILEIWDEEGNGEDTAGNGEGMD